MKFYIYSICKNEINFLMRYLEPIKNADGIYITDTGSTDGTYEKLLELQNQMPNLHVSQNIIEPWRFDIARNCAMSKIPQDADLIISVDLDDVFPSNWKEILTNHYNNGYHHIIGQYVYYENDEPKQTGIYLDRISPRKAHWEGAIHERLIIDETVETIQDMSFVVEHRQDLSKNRRELYLNCAKVGYESGDTYATLCYGYELFNSNQQPEALKIFQSIFDPESEYTTRKWLVYCAEWLVQQNRLKEALHWYQQALSLNKQNNPFEDNNLYDGRLEQIVNNLQKQVYYKIAVYAICGNEAHNVVSWMESMWEADYICVLDTGSTDGSYEKLKKYAELYPEKVIIDQKIYNPWRFDIPRNDSMKLVPADTDICICTDLDERLTPTWGEKMRNLWHDGCERGYYLYAWSHQEDGSPGRVFWYDKIHAPTKWQWHFPVHEALLNPDYPDNALPASKVIRLPDNFIMLHHYPSYKEGRSNYLPLLELRAQENKDDFYGLVYLAHEYRYQGKLQECIDFINTTVLPMIRKGNDNMSCETDLYMFLGNCYKDLKQFKDAEISYKAGIIADPTFRDNYIRLGCLYLETDRAEECIDIINLAFKKTRRHYSWLETNTVWTWEPWDLLCLAYWNLKAVNASYDCARMAYLADSGNTRLKNNVELLQKILSNNQEG